MVNEAMEVTDTEVVQGGGMQETTIIEDKRNMEQVVEGGIAEERIDANGGWNYMFNDKLYGQKHQYYHLDLEVLACMDVVHMDCPHGAAKYLNHPARNKS